MASAAPAIVLGRDCTLQAAGALRADLLGRLASPQAVSVDATRVERIDTACLQLLVAFVRDCSRQDRPVTWHGPSDALLDAARLSGLDAALALDLRS